MTISLYDATVARYLQTLPAVEGVLRKGAEWAAENEIPVDELLEKRLYDDMLPLRFQLVSVRHHSLGALQGVAAGAFSPPPAVDADYAGFQELLSGTRSELEQYDAAQVEDLAGRDITFSTQSFSLDFVGRDFLLSFSLPNFYFHATTAYDILRSCGVPLGKRDFMGRMALKG